MSDVYKVLAQAAPATTALTDLYTASTTVQVVVSKLAVSFKATTGTTSFSVSIAVAAAANNDKQYIAQNVPIGLGEAITLAEGVTLGPADVIRVKCFDTLGNLAFNLFGVEKS